MGYACPVCNIPQQDGDHLANHLAFTALLHNDDHETWLNQHAPDWESRTPSALADEITPLAEETEYTAVFDDTTHTNRPKPDLNYPPLDPAVPDETTREIIDTARELTKKAHPDHADSDESTNT